LRELVREAKANQQEFQARVLGTNAGQSRPAGT